MTKLTKKEVQYGRGMIHSHCGKVFPNDTGYCKHFIETKGRLSLGQGYMGSCQIVEGDISPLFWCAEFSKAKK